LQYVNLAYLAAAVCFILGLKMLSAPRTARFGNAIGAFGMLVAVVATVLKYKVGDLGTVLLGVAIGSLVGGALAVTVKMTAMPQMVALLNGFGGAASALVGMADQIERVFHGTPPDQGQMVPISLSVLIGALTLTGSLVAFAKLQELVSGKPVLFPLQKTLNLLLVAAAVAMAAWMVAEPGNTLPLYVLAGLACLLGVTLVIPIGGADMPVVISLLNSYSGLAACAAGFVLNNNALIISGSLVGASGVILTNIMCKAMNRSLANVLFGGFGATTQAPGAAGAAGAPGGGVVRSGSVEDAAMIFDTAQKVIVVPGYGMAVAQAQHAVRELADVLAKRGVEVKYAIHPVAGRMPGHMNVLLAEANVPYDQLFEMDAINPDFAQTDVALVIGANDITNPAARSKTDSPLYGMPILEVDKAQAIFVLKRSMNPGFAGIDNELYYDPKTMMIFGDAKDTVTKLCQAVKALG
jgi:NAD(P) transhydrogenase subunit beta